MGERAILGQREKVTTMHVKHDFWWQKAIIYQIYLRSFKDSNGDGIGDLEGVIEKIPYLSGLGVDVLWISPHYDSPMDDFGYDVRNFKKVSNDYGTLKTFKALLHKAHDNDIRIITDLVLNHTSNEHAWFQAAKNPNHPDHAKYHDYYIWHEPKYDENGKRRRPTRWIGWFGNPAWSYNEATDEYYLHIFSKKMPDLNWRNASMRENMKDIIRFWLDMGVDGFRVDASNHLEKNWEFPDAYPGYEHFSSLPKHHTYLRELYDDVFSDYDCLLMGESGGATEDEALQYVAFESREFDLLLHFGHCWADTDGSDDRLNGKWAMGELDTSKIKESFSHWYKMLEGKGWNLMYWHNHDHPRIVSHYGDDKTYRRRSAKTLAYLLLYLRGTILLYQGEEIGMTNVRYESIDEFRDVEVFTEYDNMLEAGLTEENALSLIRERARDNARSPMQWNDGKHGGFSTVNPWMKTNTNYPDINVKKEQNDPDSVLSTYRHLIKSRKKDQTIASGHICFFEKKDKDHITYSNKTMNGMYLISGNLSEKVKEVVVVGLNLNQFKVLHNSADTLHIDNNTIQLAPYQGVVFYKKC